jgi:magnesium transporter
MPSRYFRKRSHKAGLPPGALVPIGKATSVSTTIDSIIFNSDELIVNQSIDASDIDAHVEDTRILWLDVKGLKQIDAVEMIGRKFNLHPLVLEDILNSAQRPKIEDYNDYLFIVIKSLRYDDVDFVTETEQISFILGKNFVITLRDVESPLFEPVIQRLKVRKSKLREGKVDYLTYSCIDLIIDNYFLILEKIGDRIETIEDALVSKPSHQTLGQIHKLKTDLIFLRKSLWPLREIISRMLGGDIPFINESLRPYLRDLFDHAIHAIDTVETFRDITSGMIDIYLSSVNNRLNETMRVLTIIATIFIPLTFLCGWYGMNFDDMPELKWRYGYPMVITLAIAVASSMLFYFRKKKWI